MRKRVGYYIERAARKYLDLPEPEPGDILRRVARRRMEEMRIPLTKSERPFCRVQIRAGGQCRNRVSLRADGSHDECCHVHAGLPLDPL